MITRMTITLLSLPFLAALSCCAQIEIPEGTRIRVRLEQRLSSATNAEGQPVRLKVVDDVEIKGVVVIAEGSSVTGTVVEVDHRGLMGRNGRLDFSVDHGTAVDGSSIALRYLPFRTRGVSKGQRTGVLASGAALVLLPAAPFIRGKDVTVSRGGNFDVFTDRAKILRSVSLEAARSPITAPQGVQQLVSMQPAHQTAQPISERPLTNADVLALKHAHLLDELIIAKICSTAGQYNLDTETLIQMKKAGLSDVILEAMIASAKR